MRPSERSRIPLILGGLATALLLGLLFTVRSAVMPAGSMLPGIAPGDRIVHERLSYLLAEPRPGDVVVYRSPLHPGKEHVKRVVAVAGQTVRVRGQDVEIDGAKLPRVERETIEVAPPAEDNLFAPPPTLYRVSEETVDGRTYRILHDPARTERRCNLGCDDAVRVEPGQVFLLGDHRDLSADSRIHGPVPVEAIRGRVLASF